MKIYGVALLAFCFLLGKLLGNLLGYLMQFDKYLGVKELLPFAKGISAKSISFDKSGAEENADFERMIKLIKSYSFEGYIAIEYEGGFMNTIQNNSSDYLSNIEGVHATKKTEKYDAD